MYNTYYSICYNVTYIIPCNIIVQYDTLYNNTICYNVL